MRRKADGRVLNLKMQDAKSSFRLDLVPTVVHGWIGQDKDFCLIEAFACQSYDCRYIGLVRPQGSA